MEAIDGLSPCPLCGGESFRVEEIRDTGFGGGPREMRVSCSCGCSLGMSEYDHRWEALPGLIRERWNRRK